MEEIQVDDASSKNAVTALESRLQQLEARGAEQVEAQSQMYDEIAKMIQHRIDSVQSGSDQVQQQNPG